MSYTYEYPRPMVTVDNILISEKDEQEILLIKRKIDPYKNSWAFPGGFVEMDEELQEAAQRELMEETSLEIPHLRQFRAYGSLKRDPRGRTISIVYYAFINEPLKVRANDDAAEAKWFNLNKLPALAFDHKKILEDFLNAMHRQSR